MNITAVEVAIIAPKRQYDEFIPPESSSSPLLSSWSLSDRSIIPAGTAMLLLAFRYRRWPHTPTTYRLRHALVHVRWTGYDAV
jgi:hypothetical protein